MKRLNKLTSALQKIMAFLVIFCTLEWITALVALIFNVKIAMVFFISTGISFAVCVSFIFLWSLCLKAIRNKVVDITRDICEEKQKEAKANGKLHISMYAGYIVSISFYTTDKGVLNREELLAVVRNEILEDYLIIYEEISLE